MYGTNSHRSKKIILEERDAAKAEADDERNAAAAIFNKAKAAGRELTDAEARDFERIANKRNGTVWAARKKVEQLDTELKQAEAREKEIIMSAPGKQFDFEAAAAGVPGGYVDQNWRLGDPSNHVYAPQVRPKSLRAFRSERDALAGGMYLRAIEARLGGRGVDATAEQALSKFGMEITNASYEGSGTSGGYLVPPQISQTIIEIRENVGVARRVCQIYQMSSDTISIPKRSGGLTVYLPAELGTITDSDKSWSQIACNARKRAVASKVSQELMDDALISMADNVFSEMSYALALQEDNELCNGTGASSYGGVQGLLSKIGSAGVYTCPTNMDTWGEIVLADVTGTMAKLPDRFNRNPAWICSNNFYWGVFARLQASGGGNSMNDLQGGPTGKQFLGVPVFTTSQMPTATAAATVAALFGQFDLAVVLADRTGIRLGRDDSTGFLNDYTTLKATSRYDMNVHEPGDTSNPGAYVALKTAS